MQLEMNRTSATNAPALRFLSDTDKKVVGCEAFDDLAEVTALADGTIHGLAASVWTSNLSHANRLAEDIRAGTVWVNCHSYFEPTLPVGGFEQSGWGHDSGVLAVEHYLESKTVCMAV